MIADISNNDSGREALLDAIARQAARAPRQQLTLLLALATVGSVAAAFTRHGLPLAIGSSAACAAVAMLTLWELCRRSTFASVASRTSIQKILAAFGVMLWFVGGMALLLALLGDPWQL